MSASQHITWLNLVEKTGPFLAVSVLDEALPQGLEKVETRRRQRVRSAYDEWRDAVDAEDTELTALHREWVRLILEELLEYDSLMLRANDQLPATLVYREPMCGVEVRPTFAATTGETARLLIAVYSPDCDLTAPLPGDAWITASPIERMTQLCRATGVRLGLLTNGERWSVVSVPSEGTSSVATWFARIWQQEPVTLQAFVSLLGVRRCFGPTAGTLETLLANSLNDQNEITDTLGEQVRRAVEVLVQALDKADAAQNRTLLTGVTPPQLYEAGLTVMMRLVVLLCAEQRGLLLLGVDTYDQYYAATTLRVRLEKEKKDLTDDVQERRHDAWARLLALCRGVFGGIEHSTLRLPPLGGSLFDPDRFPFLEGRAAGTTWRETPSVPLPIDNRTVLTLLNALQVLEQSAGAQFLSYEALDVEQIGHVYEGLLERTVRRVPEVTIGVIGSAKAYNPNIALSELEEKTEKGRDSLLTFLQEQTGRSESAIQKALDRPADEAVRHRLAMACGTRAELAPRILPFSNLIRADSAKRLLIYDAGSYIVTLGDSRRATGTHYTPKSLTEPIVQHTLEPLVYVGPAEGNPRRDWKLKSPPELLALKVCDMAVGSAAFLVQACRWLADRLVESWDASEKAGHSVSIDGVVLDETGKAELLPRDKVERVLIARRLVTSRCLYGVDKNLMAVELAKVSLWLITMMKDRPFSFLDHALKCGDSLLGVSSVQQIENFSLRPGERQSTFASANLFRYVDEATAKRRALEDLPSNNPAQIETKNRLHAEAEAATAKVKAVADCLIAFELRCLDGHAYEDKRTVEAEKVQLLMKHDADTSLKSQPPTISQLHAHAREQLRGLRPFHWAVEFPEVFTLGGFDAFVGNPPFMGNKKITGELSTDYRELVVNSIAGGVRGLADLCAYFFLRVDQLLSSRGTFCLIATDTISQGGTREVGLDQICSSGAAIFRAIKSQQWPGSAKVVVSIIWVSHLDWCGEFFLNDAKVSGITSLLTEGIGSKDSPDHLVASEGIGFIGSVVLGKGFVVSPEAAADFVRQDPKYKDVLYPLIGGEELNSTASQAASDWVICFWDWPLNQETAPEEYVGPVASDYPLCLEILRTLVKPERDLKNRKVYRERWWRFAELQKNSYLAAASGEQVLVRAIISPTHAFAFVKTGQIFNNKTILLNADHARFAILQSSIHEKWFIEYSTTMGVSTLTYYPAACLETFPFPISSRGIGILGREYHEFRNQVMHSHNEGLTKTYNRFHDRGEHSADLTQLRALHVEMDQAVAEAYGWSDLDLGHGFHATKQGERYTLSEPARRAVLDRLLALNHQRYEEEVKAGLHEKKTGKVKAAVSISRKLGARTGQGQWELL
jgi:hypothetical protein